MIDFRTLQLSGAAPSLLANHIKIPRKNLDLLMDKIRVLPSGCWEWMGAKVKGYGVVKIRAIRSSFLPAHRLCFELAYGPVPDTMHIHHQTEPPVSCMGRNCVNPSHMAVVTPAHHIVELTPGSASYVAAHRDCCANGHPYTVQTTKVKANGQRRCLLCERKNANVAYWKKREAVAPGVEKHHPRPEFRKTHCVKGHEYTPENTYINKGWRSCVICRHEASLKRSKKNRP